MPLTAGIGHLHLQKGDSVTNDDSCFSRNNYLSTIGGLHMTSSKHNDANYDQFAPNFDMAYKTTQCVSVLNLKLFVSTKAEL